MIKNHHTNKLRHWLFKKRVITRVPDQLKICGFSLTATKKLDVLLVSDSGKYRKITSINKITILSIIVTLYYSTVIVHI